MVFFSDVSGLLTSDGGDMGMVGGWVKVISGEVSNGTVISGESPPMALPSGRPRAGTEVEETENSSSEPLIGIPNG